MIEQINIKTALSENVIVDTENVYYNDKQEIINDINKIVDDKLTIKFSEIYLELNKIKNELNEKHESIKKGFQDNMKTELIKEIENLIVDKIKNFMDLISYSSGSPSKKKHFFSC